MSDPVDIQPPDIPSGGVPELANLDIDDVASTFGAGHDPLAIDTERTISVRYPGGVHVVRIRREGAGTLPIGLIGAEDRLDPLTGLLATNVWTFHATDQGPPCLHELDLNPPEILDTEVVGIPLGFERISLQAEVAEVLGCGLAKEHPMADWSECPPVPEPRAYAALGVELLIELRERFMVMLRVAGRLEWFHEECEETWLRESKAPSLQP